MIPKCGCILLPRDIFSLATFVVEDVDALQLKINVTDIVTITVDA
jgi:hypothetical protein